MYKCSQIRVTESQFQRFQYSVIRKMLDLLQKKMTEKWRRKKRKEKHQQLFQESKLFVKFNTITIICVVAPIFDVWIGGKQWFRIEK